MNLETIKTAVEQSTGLSFNEKSNTHALKHALKMYCALAKKYTLFSNEEIAKKVEISRSSVSYFLKKHNTLIDNEIYKKQFKTAENNLQFKCSI